VDLRGVTEFFFDRCRSGGLDKFAEARARIGESPGRELNTKVVESLPNHFN